MTTGICFRRKDTVRLKLVNVHQTTNHHAALQLCSVWTIFTFYLIGNILAICVFCCEIFIYKLH